MPTYRFLLTAYRGKYLSEAIDSILGQTYTDFTLTIVDDASPDDLDSIVHAYADPRITYIKHGTNSGGNDLVGHWNNCLKYINPDYDYTDTYLILASDDDTYDPGYLAELDRLLRLYPGVDVVHMRARFVDAEGKVYCTSPALGPYLSPVEYLVEYKEERIISSLQNHAFRLSALLDIGGFVNLPLAWHTDDATVLALSMNGVAYSQPVMFSFRNSGQNISSKRDDAATLSLKLQARDQFYDWLNHEYLPKITQRVGQLPANTAMRLSQKLRRLTRNMLFKADLGTVWRARKAFAKSRYLGAKGFYRALLRKIWKNYRFIFFG